VNEREIVEWLHDERAGDLDEVIRSLRERPLTEAAAVLRGLARHDDPVIRAWSASAAARAIPERAGDVIEPLLDDRDPDVRDVALEELRRVEPSRLEQELPRLLKKLRSRDVFEPVAALWALAELRAPQARDAIERVIERPAEPFHGRVAEIVLAVVDGDERALVSRLGRHEHDATPWLTKAARILGTPRLREAVEQVAASAPDDECRQIARDALARWRGT